VAHLRVLALVALACCALHRPVAGQPAEARAAVDKRLAALQTEADRLASHSRTLLGDLRKLELEREIKGQELKRAGANLAALETELDRTTRRLKEMESRRVASSETVTERLVEIYKRGRAGYAGLLLSAEDPRALGRMTRTAFSVARLDHMRFAEHRRTLDIERAALAELEGRKQALTKAQQDARTARHALDAAIAAHNRRIDELDARRDLAAQLVSELQAAAAALNGRFEASSSAGSATLRGRQGTLPWPIGGRVVSAFGRTTSTAGPSLDRNGIEVTASEGDEVRAVHSGSVTFAAPFIGFGTLVILDHGSNDFSVYGHLQDAAVSEGARIERGTVVGRAGRNPAGDASVYFELRIDGRPVNPLQWLRNK
jgi:murein hydrolase activator